MNYQLHKPTFKHQSLITILAELGCLCLIFASILYYVGANSFNTPKHRDSDISTGLVLSGFATGSSDSDSKVNIYYDKTGEGNVNNIISEDGKYVISTPSIGSNGSTGEGGNLYHVYIDENGDVHYVTNNGGEISNNTPVIDSDRVHVDVQTYAPSFISHSNNLRLFLSPFLACALLLLYVLSFHKKEKGVRLIPIVFGLPFLVTLYSLIVDCIITFQYGYLQPLLYTIIPDLILLALYAVMTLQAWKGNMDRRIILAAFACTVLFKGLDLFGLSGNIMFGSNLMYIADILGYIGIFAFAGAWFVFAFWNQPIIAPAAEAQTAAPASESPVAEATAEATVVEAPAAEEQPVSAPTDTDAP